ncbi:hypothetical protein KSP40_PGU009505 [Platanthera guangdongensis]|uniref:Uncharacterized protein n=1 Tax=Platanthera guangdongensis TaxID=2320717 RepID=A0ABR2LLG6_9ASPA
MMFSQVVATGDLAWAPNSRNFEAESVDEQDVSAEDGTQNMNDSPHSTAAKEKRTGKGKRKFTAKKAKSSALDELVETSRIIGKCMQEPPRIQISSSLFTIPEAISELESMSEVMDESQFDFYDYSTLLLKDKQNRETFMSIRKDRRLRWLQARYEKRAD